MIVIADTSPLNYLVRCGIIWILPELFGDVLIPSEVAAELTDPGAPEKVREFVERAPTWLKCIEVPEHKPGLSPSLGSGERAAITLALNLEADVLLIDDLTGRKEAQRVGVRARGTLAVLLQASTRGYLSFPEAFAQLTGLGFRVSKSIARAAFREYRLSRKN
jgi:predicted nucleic acid-binding protein